MRGPVLVEIERGGLVETRHRGAVSIVDCVGTDVYASGDPRPVFLRSAIKPFVSALVVACGAADAFSMTPEELAIIGGSHAGLDRDAELVTGLLERIGRTEADLINGAAQPSDEATKRRLECEGEEPSAIRQMCSGEHAGMLSIAVHGGWPVEGYGKPDHQVQVAIRQMVDRVFADDEAIESATDACGVPTFRVPLHTIARAFGWMARPERLPDELADLRESWVRVRDGILDHPERISGPGQLDTELTATDRAFIAKEGAEGLLGIGSVATGLGVAVSIEDGDPSRRATSVATISALSQLGLLDSDVEGRLRDAHWAPIRDSQGNEVGIAHSTVHVPHGD
ncbi:MAG TPA: asparaginase [Candidatus Limnocylindrales bacterium]|nr:asparaginase [Candidatus Limnocylindrales bacterium]